MWSFFQKWEYERGYANPTSLEFPLYISNLKRNIESDNDYLRLFYLQICKICKVQVVYEKFNNTGSGKNHKSWQLLELFKVLNVYFHDLNISYEVLKI